MRMDIISIFPEMFEAIRRYGVTGRAVENGLLQIETWNPRDYTEDRHRTVDDRPYGGGPGMVMMAEPLTAAIRDARKAATEAKVVPKVIYLSPQGKPLNHEAVCQMAAQPGLILLAGRYEGVDERALEAEVDEEWSIGDYVLSGGELPAMVLIDAVARQLPGVLGDEMSAQQDSFVEGLLDCGHYTRPELFEGRKAPEVLLSGNHELIRQWRLKQALGRTWLRRPELLQQLSLNDEQQALLTEFQQEYHSRETEDE